MTEPCQVTLLLAGLCHGGEGITAKEARRLNQTARAGGYTVPCIICGNAVPLTSATDLFELAQDVQAQPVRVCDECKAAVEKAKSGTVK